MRNPKNLVKAFVKRVSYYLVQKVIVSRREMVSDPRNDTVVLREGHRFVPAYTPSETNDERFPTMPEFVAVSPFFRCCVRDVCLIGPYGIPVTRRGRILQEPMQGSVLKCVRRTVAQLGVFKVVSLYLRALLPGKADLDCGLHMVPRHGYQAGRPNFSHWLLENMPQLFALEDLDEPGIRIVTNDSPTAWQCESLALMGFGRDDVFDHSKSMTRVGRLYIATIRSATSTQSERDPVGREWVVERLGGRRDRAEGSRRPLRVFLSRQDMRRGYITNMPDVEEVLNRYGIEVYCASDTSFQQDVDYFRHVELLVAPHGAGMANMVFARSCHVIEIACGAKWSTDLFYHTALEFGFSFDTVRAKRDHSYEESADDVEEAWSVDIRSLELAIQRCTMLDHVHPSLSS